MTTALWRTLLHLVALLTLPPLVLGVVNRTKAIAGGRKGQPLLQAYFDLAKLLRKGAVYSRTTSWVFRAGPVVGLAAVAAAGLLLSMGGAPALVSFGGDFVLFAYLLGLARFSWVIRPRGHAPHLAGPFPADASFHSTVPDPVLERALEPAAGAYAWLAGRVRALTAASLIHLQMLFIVATLVAILAWGFVS